MRLMVASRGLALGLVALFAVGCGGGDDDDDGTCTSPSITGTWFQDSGTGSVHGTGSLPAGLPDGFQLDLLLRASNGTSASVFPDDFFKQTNTCGRSFSFKVHDLPAGTFGLDYELFDPKSDAIDPAYSGQSTNQFTLTEGQDLEFTPTY